MVTFTCDVAAQPSDFSHFWEHSVGSGHAPLALRVDWRRQLERASDELGFRRVRFHGLLSGALRMLDGDGPARYSMVDVDQIVDYLVETDIAPLVELSFMPRPLASGEQTTFHYGANVTPPRDYGAWGELVGTLARHWIERYNRNRVRSWHFEVWNEPNRDQFWTGSRNDYFRLYRHTAQALRDVDGELQVGGPSTAKNEWIRPFLEFCAGQGLPVDFVSTHNYPNDFVGAQGGSIEEQLSRIERGALVDRARASRQEAGDRRLFITEWNTSAELGSHLHDEPYAAAFIVRTIMNLQGIVDAYSFWVFSDIFEEQGRPALPFHGGFGLLTLHGIAKPAYRAFEILHRLGSRQLPVDGSHPTVEAWAVRKSGDLTLLLTNHALPQHDIKTEQVTLRLKNSAQVKRVTLVRIDADHANPRRAWEEMGAPAHLSRDQIERLDEASTTETEEIDWQREGKEMTITIDLPPHAVASVLVNFYMAPPDLLDLDVKLDGVEPDNLWDQLQRSSFSYFIEAVNPANGLVKDSTRSDSEASVAAVGMALASYPVAAERGWLPREDLAERALATLRFFHDAPHGPEPDATGYHGFYYHFLDMETGRRSDRSELSSIDTGCLLAGALCARAYFDRNDPQEEEIRTLADALYRRADWTWMQNGGRALSQGWQPDTGFLDGRWKGYNEGLFLYILGLGSPTHPLPPESYQASTETYRWKKVYDWEYLYAGPLFIHQYSHLWLDLRGIRDSFMREHDSDYFENSRRATLIQQEYARRNPLAFDRYDEHFWGITASNGPGPHYGLVDGIERYFYDYLARGAPFGPDDGTVAPWAAMASLPFAPDVVLPTVRKMVRLYPDVLDTWGCKNTVNPTLKPEGHEEWGWVSDHHYGINQGPVVIMLENHRSGLLWELMRQDPYRVEGLRRAGFTGGWLENLGDSELGIG